AGGASLNVNVPAEGSVVQYAPLSANEPGRIALRASLGSTDQIIRTIEVRPAGRPVSVSRGGTLAAPRELVLELPSDLLPKSERARLMVFPGSLALIRSELSVLSQRGTVAD